MELKANEMLELRKAQMSNFSELNALSRRMTSCGECSGESDEVSLNMENVWC